jgi:hypothetical protein
MYFTNASRYSAVRYQQLSISICIIEAARNLPVRIASQISCFVRLASTHLVVAALLFSKAGFDPLPFPAGVA